MLLCNFKQSLISFEDTELNRLGATKARSPKKEMKGEQDEVSFRPPVTITGNPHSTLCCMFILTRPETRTRPPRKSVVVRSKRKMHNLQTKKNLCQKERKQCPGKGRRPRAKISSTTLSLTQSHRRGVEEMAR